jgi:hypothetical protein
MTTEVNHEPPESWLASVLRLQASVVKRQGVLPDSTLDIAADRQR